MTVFAHLDGPETDDEVALRVQTMVDAEAYLASTVEGGEQGLASYRYVVLAVLGAVPEWSRSHTRNNTDRSIRTIVVGGFKFGSLDMDVAGTCTDSDAAAAEEVGDPDPLEQRRRYVNR